MGPLMAVQPVLWPVSLIPSSSTSLILVLSIVLSLLPTPLSLHFIPSPHTPTWPSPGPPTR